MKKIILICLLGGLAIKASTQDVVTQNQISEGWQPNIALKFAPLSLMDYTPSLQGGVEVKLANSIGFQTEFGYISTLGKVEHWLHSETIELKGIRWRNELRFYLNPQSGGGFYVGPELFYKRVDQIWDETVYRYDWYYSEIVELKQTKTVFGSHVKLGRQMEVYNTRILFDLYGGFGMRYLNIDSNEPVDDSYYYSYDWFERVDGSYILPSLSLGFKIGYNF